MADWRDFDTWVVTTGAGSRDTFHDSVDCNRLNGVDAQPRSESFVAYHEPEPCPFCHPDVGWGDDGE